jgi:membrane peptidoglycan carboxypeptidase
MANNSSWWNSDNNDLYKRYSIPSTPQKKQTFSRSYAERYTSVYSHGSNFFSSLKAMFNGKSNWYWFFKNTNLKLSIVYLIGGLFAIYFLWVFFFVSTQLPDITIESLENGNFSQTSVVTDKNDQVLYRFYEENREFISYESIAPQTINAFIAIEDQSFWQNGWVDYKGIVRAIYSSIKKFIGMDARVWWASTITQQLLKNILWLNKDEKGFYDTVVRKHKERLLVGKLADVIKTDVRKKFPAVSSDVIEKKQKERVMELYINFIYLGNQTYGIQAAAQSYFNKSAKDLTVVEWSILASMPQSPSYYNPYKNPKRVMWGLEVKGVDGTLITSWEVYNSVVNYIGNLMFDANSTISKWNNTFQDYITDLIPKNVTLNNAIYTIEYTVGRKDAVLNRMYEDNYITEEELKKSFVEGLLLKLSSGKVEIKTPHFVFWVRDLITKDPRFKNLEITEDMLYGWWLIIKTTLDINIQNIAEKSIQDNMSILYDRWGNNRSMIHVDTISGDVLAYVWSANYNNTDIEWQNDMIRNSRQPWSSIKPLIYAYLLQTLPITIDTPIYDIPFTVWGLTPRNADGKFEWLLPLRQALSHSRNIPAVKAYLAAGQEEKIKPFLQGLGLTSLKNNHEYWYSLSLWAGEVSMLEMAQSYSALSQLWTSADINPILELKDKNGNILYQKKIEKKDTWLKPEVAFMMWEILSNTANMPWGWVSYYSIKWLKYWVKSWTSNKVIKDGDEEVSVPRDGWLATYTPSRVTMYWAGNANDKPMNKNALWLLLNSEVNKAFYNQMLDQWYIKNDSMPKVDVKSVTISKITGRLANDNTPEEFKVTTLAYNANIPWDNTYTPISVDSTCGGKISPLTPPEQRQRVLIFTPISITSFDSQNISDWYAWQNKKMVTEPNNIYAKLFTKEPVDYCEGRIVEESDSVQLSTSLVKNQTITSKFTLPFSAQSSTGIITRVTVLVNDIVVGDYPYDIANVNDSKSVKLNANISGNVTLQIIALDNTNKSKTLTIPIIVWTIDTDKPIIDVSSIKVMPIQTGWYNVSFVFLDKTSGISNSVINLPNGTKQNFKWNTVKFIISELWIVNYSVIDLFKNQTDGTINLTDYVNTDV